MSTWMIIAVVWLALGLLCYAAILRFFPPTPLIDARFREPAEEEEKSRLFSIRDLPRMAVLLIPTALISPLLLCGLLCSKLRKSTNATTNSQHRCNNRPTTHRAGLP